ncbi:uncharacterized protein METZ01_LOCUS86109, partial [marine metagenome]
MVNVRKGKKLKNVTSKVKGPLKEETPHGSVDQPSTRVPDPSVEQPLLDKMEVYLSEDKIAEVRRA